MKKFLNVILIIAVLIAASSCGASKRITNDPYTGYGVGSSYDENIAREIAYTNAVDEINRKHVRNAHDEAYKDYASSTNARGKQTENLRYDISLKQVSNSNLNDIVVTKEKTRKTFNGFVGEIWVAVSPDNIE